MTHYPFNLPQIVSWYRAKGRALEGSGISMLEIRESTEHVPTAGVDFQSSRSYANITTWVTGAFDFLILRASDGEPLYSSHVDATEINETLEEAFTEFIRNISALE